MNLLTNELDNPPPSLKNYLPDDLEMLFIGVTCSIEDRIRHKEGYCPVISEVR